MKIYTAWTTAIAVTLSSIALAAAPAEARQRHGSRHHRNGADVGAIFAGIALFGVVAAIAGSASESKARERAERERRAYERERALERERAEYYPRHMESRRYDNRYDNRYENRYERQGTAYYDRTSEHRATAPYATPPAPPAPATMAEDVPDRRAVEACSWAAEGHIGTTARIGYINSADGYRQGWRVTGTVALPGQAVQNFDCLFESGRVTGLSIK